MFPLAVRSPRSRLWPGWRRKGRSFQAPITQPHTTGGNVLVINAPPPGLLPGSPIEFVKIEIRPHGVFSSAGLPFYSTPEIITVGAAGAWAAFLMTTTSFSDPLMFYLVTEYRTDGLTPNTYKLHIPAGTTGTVYVKDVMI